MLLKQFLKTLFCIVLRGDIVVEKLGNRSQASKLKQSAIGKKEEGLLLFWPFLQAQALWFLYQHNREHAYY